MIDILQGWLTPEQAAKTVGKSTQTIYHHIKNEHFVVERIGGRLFINQESLLDYYGIEKTVDMAEKRTG